MAATGHPVSTSGQFLMATDSRSFRRPPVATTRAEFFPPPVVPGPDTAVPKSARLSA